MKQKSQKQTWDNIAPEWHKHKTRASTLAIEFLNKQKGNVLEIGAGSGRHLQQIKNGKMYITDFSKEMIRLAKQKARKQKISAECIVADMTKLPFEDNFFDAALSISSLHSIFQEQQEQAIKELYRVMKPKAQALIGVWNKESKRFKRYREQEKYIGWTDKGKRYYYLFREDEIHNLFKKAGFKILEKKNSELMIRFIVEK